MTTCSVFAICVINLYYYRKIAFKLKKMHWKIQNITYYNTNTLVNCILNQRNLKETWMPNVNISNNMKSYIRHFT